MTSALSDNWYESAPYYSVLDSGAPDLGTVMSATGQKAFDMAFILADGSSCAPAWNGTDPVPGDTQVASAISEIRSDGGDVVVSAGGYNGTKLGQVCGSAAATAAATAAAYQQVEVDRQSMELQRGARRLVGRLEQRRRLLTANVCRGRKLRYDCRL